MPTMSTEFTVPCTPDKAVIAIQDVINQFGWSVLELTPTRVVTTAPGQPLQTANFPKATLMLQEVSKGTRIGVTMTKRTIGEKKMLTGLMGKLVNGISLRVQTQSIAINPTVQIGEGQSESPQADRFDQLKKAKELLDAGILTQEEFEIEKRKLLES